MLVFFNLRLEASIGNQLSEFVSIFSKLLYKHRLFERFKWIHHGLNNYRKGVYSQIICCAPSWKTGLYFKAI